MVGVGVKFLRRERGGRPQGAPLHIRSTPVLTMATAGRVHGRGILIIFIRCQFANINL
jgi:hypothetical protein